MALVSYVDVLEVVGELKDLKQKLVEAEGIVQKGGVKDVSAKEKGDGKCIITALCQSEEADLVLHLVSISIVSEPRLVECKCSCLEGNSGRCQHIVAALMFVHRNNITVEMPCVNLDIKSERMGFDGCTDGSVTTAIADIVEPLSTQCNFTSSSGSTLQDGVNIEEVRIKEDRELAMETDILPVLIMDQDQVVDMNPKLVDECLLVEKEPSTINSEATTTEKDCITRKRLGRGQRKTVPNPKYNAESKQFSCPTCNKIFGNKNHYETHLRSHTGEKLFVCEVCGLRYSQKRTLLKHKESSACGGETSLKCHICNAILGSQSELDNHKSSHPAETDNKCCICHKSFRHRKGLLMHQRVHAQNSSNSDDTTDKGSAFVCDKCGKQFKQQHQFLQHQETHTLDKSFKCLECGKSFSRERTFKSHKHVKKDDVVPNSSTPKVRKVSTCDICGKEFTNRVHHEEHLRSHTGERPFQCVECGKGFATKRSLRNHSHGGKNSRDRPHSCSECSASFATSFMLKVHKKCHSDERPFSCAECGKSYRSQHVYQDHLDQHKGIKSHKCKECGKSFTWRTSLWSHTANHAKKKPFECIQCGAMFAEQTELKDHWGVHLDDKPYQCPDCGIGFMLEDDCDKHIEIHKNSPSYPCTKCDEKFKWANELSRHMQTHKEKKRFLCPTCGQTFATKGHQKIHMMIHTGEKPFECETCHKRFYTRSLLRKHTVFHSNDRPFECVLCQDKFPTQGILRAHIRIHTGEKPFCCDQCGKSFPQSSYLKRHMLTHSKDRPFPCPECENAFVTKYDLKVHMRTHTGDKPFSCSECDEQFFEGAQLTSHLRTHSEEPPFLCDLCGKGFNSSNGLKKHFGRAHPTESPFFCSDCGERFLMQDTLRKHRKSRHNSKTDSEAPFVLNSSSEEKTGKDTSVKVEKDPLNRLIEDSQILVDEASDVSNDAVNGSMQEVLTQDYEILEVNLVDSSELINLSEGYQCETVEVYHAESLSGLEGSGAFQTVTFTSLPVHNVESPILVKPGTPESNITS